MGSDSDEGALRLTAAHGWNPSWQLSSSYSSWRGNIQRRREPARKHTHWIWGIKSWGNEDKPQKFTATITLCMCTGAQHTVQLYVGIAQTRNIC